MSNIWLHGLMSYDDWVHYNLNGSDDSELFAELSTKLRKECYDHYVEQWREEWEA